MNILQYSAKTFTEFVPNYLKSKSKNVPSNENNYKSESQIYEKTRPINEDKNRNESIINEIKNKYESEKKELINQFNKEKEQNLALINENNKLKEEINNLNIQINKLNDEKKLIENDLKEKNKEIKKLITKNNLHNNYVVTSINQGEQIMTVNFVSMGTNDIGHFSLVCKNKDLFVTLEERLYEEFPKFKDYETYFEVKTKRIKRFKSLKDNNIQSNDVINMFIIDE